MAKPSPQSLDGGTSELLELVEHVRGIEVELDGEPVSPLPQSDDLRELLALRGRQTFDLPRQRGTIGDTVQRPRQRLPRSQRSPRSPIVNGRGRGTLAMVDEIGWRAVPAPRPCPSRGEREHRGAPAGRVGFCGERVARDTHHPP